MTPIEKQILENQKAIMTFFKNEDNDLDLDLFLESCINKTDKIIRPKNREEPCVEMPEREFVESKDGEKEK